MSNKEIDETIGANLEAQLNDLLGVPVTSMDDKIDAAMSKIVSDSAGNLGAVNQAASGTAKKNKKTTNTKKGKQKTADFKNTKQKTTDQKPVKQAKAGKIPEYDDHKSKKGKVFGILLAVLAVACICVYVGFSFQYKDVFWDGTFINGADCSKMTVAEAESNLKAKVENYAIQLDFKNDESETIDGTAIGYSYVSDGTVEKIKAGQSMFLWIKGLFGKEEYEVAESITFDENLLKEQLDGLAHMQAENQTAPEDAYVGFVDSKFQIIPETEGTQIDEASLFEQLKTAVSASQTEFNVPEAGVYAQPTILSDSQQLAGEYDRLTTQAGAVITFELPQGDQVLDGNTLRTWLSKDEDGNLYMAGDVVEQKVKEYVEAMAEETDSVGKERTFHSTMQGDITVSGGIYGWKIDTKTEEAQLVEEILGNKVVTRTPTYTSEELTKKDDNNGFGTTYVEIDLTNQHLWYYVDGEVYVESDIVSGTATKSDRKTPGGIYLLYYKQRDKVLSGQLTADGVPSYQSPVKYWMPFNGGIGMHDASWRDEFGGTIYKYSGSHGCINLPTKKAAAIYEKIDKKTPIICYY